MLVVSELRQYSFEPMLGRRIVIDIAIDTSMDARSAEPFQRGIELPAAFAEVIERRVAECEYRKPDATQIGAVAVHHRLPERYHAVGRFTIAVGADYHQDTLGPPQHIWLTVRHVSHF